MLFTVSDVAEVRHIVQGILVPCVFVVGLLGNSVSIYVLTRKRMRCTTNIYLTALAITDIIYLTMELLLSLQHNEYMQRHCEIYWQHYGVVVWLHDAWAYISIYIAVCFTIERFIAVRYPLKRHTFCTETLAKCAISVVVLFCLLTTISTGFEYQYYTDYKLINPSDGRPCNFSEATTPHTTNSTLAASAGATGTAMLKGMGSSSDSSSNGSNLVLQRSAFGVTEKDTFYGSGESGVLADKAYDGLARDIKLPEIQLNVISNQVIPTNGAYEIDESAEFTPPRTSVSYPESMNGLPKPNVRENTSLTVNVDYCKNVTFYKHKFSDLGNNELYKRILFLYTLIVFVLIPLSVLATFNLFLIMLVRRSKNLRGEMTNANSIRRPKRKSTMSSVSQENRVTVTLIAVVLLFIICQLPWAIYLIVSDNVDIDINLATILGNIFNFLVDINAAANFFLYCVLSDKYRSMVRQLITGYRHRARTLRSHSSQHNNNNKTNSSNMNASLYSTTTASGLSSTNSCRRYRPTIIK